jgi:hypothetical protein
LLHLHRKSQSYQGSPKVQRIYLHRLNDQQTKSIQLQTIPKGQRQAKQTGENHNAEEDYEARQQQLLQHA